MDRFLKRPAESPARSSAPAKRTKPSELSRQGSVSAADRAAQYFCWEGLEAPRYCQKGLQFIRLVRFLDQRQASLLQPLIDDLLKIPLFGEVPREQLHSYLEEVNIVKVHSVRKYWETRLDRLGHLARAAIINLSIPCHSCEVERSFSAYSRIVTKLRTGMKDSTVRTCNMVHFNSIV